MSLDRPVSRRVHGVGYQYGGTRGVQCRRYGVLQRLIHSLCFRRKWLALLRVRLEILRTLGRVLLSSLSVSVAFRVPYLPGYRQGECLHLYLPYSLRLSQHPALLLVR